MVTSRATLAIVDQLARALVLLGLREFLERRPTASPAAAMKRPRDRISLLLLLAVFLVIGAWSLGSLGTVAWWLITGRGLGGRVVAAGTVAPRHYDIRGRAGMPRP